MIIIINDNYFSKIGSVRCTPGIIPNEITLLNGVPLTLDRTPFTEEEVLEVCNEVNLHKSASIMNVKCMILKDAFTMYSN